MIKLKSFFKVVLDAIMILMILWVLVWLVALADSFINSPEAAVDSYEPAKRPAGVIYYAAQV